jgi:aminoglycoside phosphotransferase (APT) family kinase protein
VDDALDERPLNPTEADAARVLKLATGKSARHIVRFPTGLAHFVFDTIADDGEPFVVRLTRLAQQDAFAGAVRWHGLLKPLGVPLPAMLYADVGGTATGFPALVLERLPGTDLGAVYPSLTGTEKAALAEQIIAIQRLAGSLPRASGYGHAYSYQDAALQPSWKAVLDRSLERIRGRLRKAGIIDAAIVERVQARVDGETAYLAGVQPVCFLDDTTTKNVIVDGGRLSGIVDVDCLCFGDPLLTPALTRTALLSAGRDGDYVDFWTEALGISTEERRMLHVYCALFCVEFLSEIGQTFNTAAPAPVDVERAARLTRMADAFLDGSALR